MRCEPRRYHQTRHGREAIKNSQSSRRCWLRSILKKPDVGRREKVCPKSGRNQPAAGELGRGLPDQYKEALWLVPTDWKRTVPFHPQTNLGTESNSIRGQLHRARPQPKKGHECGSPACCSL